MPDPLVDRLRHSLAPAYELVRELGGGGMSRVFVARETALDREVVVKVVAPEIGAGVSAERFRREIQLAARLQHPSVVPLFTAGSDGALLWYTMPFVEGETLRDLLRREGRLRVIDAVRLWRDLLAALAHAHARGIVHRDVKPENVLLTGGRAVVTDFGVAKALDLARGGDAGGETLDDVARDDASRGAAADASSPSPVPAPPGYALTSRGFALGTPEYMAPEQALADPTADERVDLYAAGLLMYEMLAGSGPFTDARTPQQHVAAHVTRPPPPLAVPNLPPQLGDLVLRCLAKDPAERPPGVQAVLDQVDGIVREFLGAGAVALGVVTGEAAAAPRSRPAGVIAQLWGRAADAIRRRGERGGQR